MTERNEQGRYVRRPKDRAAKPFPDTAIITVYLDRQSGDITIDDEFSTNAETWYMLERASEIVRERQSDA